jgi:ribose transport system ATP-binding protein
MPQEKNTIPVLQIEGLSNALTRAAFGRVVSLTINRADPRALQGQNESGESTLIKVLSGYRAPDPGGGIRIHDKKVPVKSPVHS